LQHDPAEHPPLAPAPTATTEILVIPPGATHEYVPDVVYDIEPGAVFP
jgi:hypothetical protein